MNYKFGASMIYCYWLTMQIIIAILLPKYIYGPTFSMCLGALIFTIYLLTYSDKLYLYIILTIIWHLSLILFSISGLYKSNIFIDIFLFTIYLLYLHIRHNTTFYHVYSDVKYIVKNNIYLHKNRYNRYFDYNWWFSNEIQKIN
jgi:hypothetical protein